MIYKMNESVTLYGADADEFLESVGVCLYENSLSINESMFDGECGESILNENGIFLYEDGIVLEGEQAEAYKARKAKEKEEESKKYDKYDNKGYTIDPLKGKRARSNVGNQASLKQLSLDKRSFKNHDNTRSNDRVRKDMAEEIVERERLSRHGSYAGKGIEIRKDSNGKYNSWFVPGKSSNGGNPAFGDKYGDSERDRRIAHNAARDAANRHLRRHTKIVKQHEIASIFESIKLV